MNNKIRAMQLVGYNEPLRLNLVDKPKPNARQLLLKIHSVGMNFGDTLLIKGTYQEKPSLPFTIGMEICGTIEAIGSDISNFSIGDRVATYSGFGGLSEYGCFEADQCVLVPDSMSSEDAAAFLVAYGTSHIALERRARLLAGETLLVLGASGGVGLTAVELGKLMGAKVIACARGQQKLDVCKKMGADYLIDSDTDDIRDIVKSLGGADVVYDPVGGEQFEAALRACKPEARILPLGFASGNVPQIPANIILVKNIEIIGFYWGGYTKFNPKVLIDSFNKLFEWHSSGKLKPHISNILPLEKANEALDLLRERKATGKVIVKVD